MNQSKIVIIDYGLGNLCSAQKALEHAGAQVIITKVEAVVESADGVVLPGVGAFRSGMEQLLPLKQVVIEGVKAGKPLLGICLGMQMLFTESEEGGLTGGLDLIQGRVVRFDSESKLKIPHMGWNRLNIKQKHPLLRGIKNPYVYFVHSYYAVTDAGFTLATANYGIDFTAVAASENVLGTQFHPEKSGDVGLKMIRNFVKMCGR